MRYFLALVVVCSLSRLLPHPPNVVCVAAVGLFAGAMIEKKWSYAIPALAMLLSDIVGHFAGVSGVTFYNPMIMLGVYASMTLSVLIGRWLGSSWHQGSATRVLSRVTLATLLASTTFFVFSNLAVWAYGWYPTTGAGLLACFTAAIPFYGYTLAGDLAYSGIIFGAYYAVRATRTQADSAPAAC
ncbi:MAG: DUF6580 family putative transport protein [Planctomycetota bacterium]